MDPLPAPSPVICSKLKSNVCLHGYWVHSGVGAYIVVMETGLVSKLTLCAPYSNILLSSAKWILLLVKSVRK